MYPSERIVEFVSRIVGDGFENLFEPLEGVYVAQFAGSEEKNRTGDTLRSLM